ncbi:MAG: sulfur carrier protein ThiS [Pseudomonadota bacterium]
MLIILNGHPRSVDPQSTLKDLLRRLELQNRRLAVEVNQKVISRSEHIKFKLSEGDKVEIIQAVGGG